MDPNRNTSVEILAIGKELVQGEVVDTNSAFIANQLVPLGLSVSFHTTANDDLGSVRAALETACARARFVIATGGIGPTEDDLTRDAVAKLCNVELVLHEESLAHIERLFSDRGMDMPACNRVQAMLPAGAVVVPNPVGTAAGFETRYQDSIIFSLPGVPREMKAMLERVVARVVEEAEVREIGVVRILNCFGIPESKINEQIGFMMAPDRNPGLGTMACEGIIRLRLLASAATEREAEGLLDEDERAIRKELGDAVFSRGDETLAEVVARGVAERELTIATAESCTGGLIGHWLTQVPGISTWYRGGVVAYSNEVKSDLLGVPSCLFDTVGAVSLEVAKAMAQGVAERLQTQIGVGVTGIAGPTGGTPSKPVGLVHAAVALRGALRHEELRLFGDRATIKDRAAKSVLNLLRSALMNMEDR